MINLDVKAFFLLVYMEVSGDHLSTWTSQNSEFLGE